MSYSNKTEQQSTEDSIAATLQRLEVTVKGKRQKIEAQRLPDESYEEAEQRFYDQLTEQKKQANTAPALQKKTPSMRKAPNNEVQADFFIPNMWDVSTKDSRTIMDVAVFRLSKRDKRAGDTIRYTLSDGYIEVKAGPDGMASVWDYDIVLMGISHLTESANAYRKGLGEKPGRVFKPHVSEILKFCRRSNGGRQYEEIEAALDRLKNTTLKIVRNKKGKGGRVMRESEAEGLISNYRTIAYADNGRISNVEIELPQWIYREVVECQNPEVLTVHPEFFLIDLGIGRYLYRLARQAAGKGSAKWSFQTLYERSGSTGQLKKFTFNIRKLIATNDLPEYHLAEEQGVSGPLLVMTHRDAFMAQAEAEEDDAPEEGANDALNEEGSE